MKNRVIIFLLILGVSSDFLNGQDTLTIFEDSARFRKIEIPPRVTNLLKTNPFSLLFGNIPFYTGEAMLVYETNVSLYQTVFIGASYLFKSPLLTLSEKDTSFNPQGIKYLVNGWRVQAGYKFYINGWMKHKRDKFKGLAPKGFYVSPHISYSTAKITDAFHKARNEYYRITFFNVDIRTGYQLLVRRKFALDAFTGFGFMNNTVVYHDSNKSNYPVDTSDYGYFYTSYLKIVFGFNLGFAF